MKKLLRILFSRYLISAVIIILEVAVIAYLVLTMSELSGLFLLITLIVGALTLISIINNDCNPEYKVTWIAIVLLVPTLGALLYILFRHRTVRKEDIELGERVSRELSMYNTDTRVLGELKTVSRTASGRAVAIMAADALSGVYRGSARYYSSGEEMFSAMLGELALAEKYIFLEYFIIDEGDMWDKLSEVLIERARSGVEVRLIYDDVGTAGRLPEGFDNSLGEAGIEVRRFGPFYPRFSATHNNRDHRKLCIIDGRVAFTGGINIGDEYINKTSRLGYWKDGGVSLFGDAVRGFVMQYLYVWGITDKSLESYEGYLVKGKDEDSTPADRQSGTAADKSCATSAEKEDTAVADDNCATANNRDTAVDENDGGFYLPFGSGPSPLYKSRGGKRAIIDILSAAEEYVYITTPYLIIDFDLTEALISAARRGVDVRIVTPLKPDKKTVKVMTKSSYPHLLKNGVRIFEYQPGFIHQKLIVADRKYTMIGTINLDYRSLAHHLEDAVWCYNSPIASDAKGDVDNILLSSREISERDARLTLPELCIKCALRLFAPLF